MQATSKLILQRKVLLEGGRRHSEGVARAGLIAIQADVTIWQKMAHSELLDCVWMLFCELVIFRVAADPENGARCGVIFSMTIRAAFGVIFIFCLPAVTTALCLNALK